MSTNSLNSTDTILVGYDYTHGKDKGVLVVGRKRINESIEIINAFEGEEAEKLYNQSTRKEKK